MRITWRDGAATLTTAGAIVLQYAYYHDWSWSLVSSTRWVVTGLGLLLAIGFVSSYVLDPLRSAGWSLLAGLIALSGVALAALGLGYADSAYVGWMLAANVVFWFASIGRHLTISPPLIHHHA